MSADGASRGGPRATTGRRAAGDPPLLLAFDVSTSVGSAGVARGQELLAHAYLLDSREQAARLVPACAGVLEEAGVAAADLDGVVVGKGPGSFTGLRIAAATARGIGAGLRVPVWPRSSLAAAAVSAWAPVPRARDGSPASPPPAADPAPGSGIDAALLPAGTDPGLRHVLFDAGGDRVYAAAYRFRPAAGASANGRGDQGAVETVLEPRAATVGEILRFGPPRMALFAGDGALRHARTLEAAGFRVLGYPAGVPTAAALLRLHALLPNEDPEARWQPEYLRGSSARPPLGSGERSR